MPEMSEDLDKKLAAFCAESRLIVSHPIYIAASSAIWISSMMTIVATCIIVIKFRKKFYFHLNAKMLYICMMIFCLAYSATTLSALSVHLWSLVTIQQDCDVVFYSSYCSPFRRVSMTSFFGIFFVQMAFLLERSAAFVKGSRYEREGCFLGCFLTAFSVVVPIGLMLWVMNDDNVAEWNTFCIAATSSPSIGEKYFNLHYMILFGDLGMLIYFSSLWKKNSRGAKIYSESSLGSKFQTKENLDVLRSVAPLILSNTILISIYVIMLVVARSVKIYITVMTYKIWLMSAFVIPHYSFIMVICIYWSLRQQAKKREDQLQSLKVNSEEKSEAYFKAYAQNW